jgi:hypothetical protein
MLAHGFEQAYNFGACEWLDLVPVLFRFVVQPTEPGSKIGGNDFAVDGFIQGDAQST